MRRISSKRKHFSSAAMIFLLAVAVGTSGCYAAAPLAYSVASGVAQGAITNTIANRMNPQTSKSPARAKGPQMTQLQKRQLQQRTYESIEKSRILSVSLAVLQDDGFIVTNSDTELGVLTMTKSKTEQGTTTYAAGLFYNVSLPSTEYQNIQANLSATPWGEKIRVRISASFMKTGTTGLDSDELLEPGFYRNFFAKLEKGIFIDQEGL